ncbi:MAG: fasciclin domain-containing protein, partial [Saprospiraceae bacterium]|nr:fasciclin domain-containing protein [Saprospiraceae bacterium]
MFKPSFFLPKVLLLLCFALFLQNCTKDQFATTEKEDLTEIENAINLDLAQDLQELAEDEVQPRSSSYYTFNTLNQALECTNLDEALFSGDKTVYAPSDAAFAKLGLNENNVCQALNATTLTNILLYHVVDRSVSLSELGCIEMLNGDITQTERRNFRLFINDSRIFLAFHQRGSNYNLQVHAIQDVLQVPSKTIVETAVGASQFSSLVAAVLAADPAIAAA